jgi:hypothetical protein
MLALRGLVALTVVLLASATPARAAMFSAGSVAELIAAIHASNQNTEPDSVAMAAGTTFTLTSANISTYGPTGLPAIAASESLSIVGNGAIIERSTVVGTPAFRLFSVAAGASLVLENLTLQRGRTFGTGVSAQGGAILNQGTLALHDVIVQNNSAEGWIPPTASPLLSLRAAGGAIYSNGSLTVEGGAIQNNQAIGGNGRTAATGRGGGELPATVGGPALGGGLYVAGGTVNLWDVSLAENVARGGKGGNGHPTHGSSNGVGGGAGLGGGMYIAAGTLNLSDLTVSSNSASGGAGGNGGNGAFTGNGGNGGAGFGGGLYAHDGSIEFHDSSVTANSAQGGAGGLRGSSSTATNGTPGEGKAGGFYIASAQVGLDEFTVDQFVGNIAATSDPNIFGPFEIIVDPTPLPGDFNGDGTVDAADYIVLRKTGGLPDDYNTWRANFGRTLFFGSAGATGYATTHAEPQSPVVPEPTTLVTLLVGVLLVDVRRRVSVSSEVRRPRAPIPRLYASGFCCR